LTAIARLSQIIAQRGKTSKTAFANQADFDRIIESGLIELTGKVQSLVCDECDDPHDAELVFADSAYGYYCHELGFIRVEDQRTHAVKPVISKLIDGLASTYECKRRKSTPISGDTWRIGSITTQEGDLALYFHPSLQTEDDVRDVQTALSYETRSAFRVLITAVGTLMITDAKVVELVDAVEFQEKTGKLDPIIDLRTIAGVPPMRTGGHPNYYKQPLRELSALREKEGHTLVGRNEEAKALRLAFRAKFPDRKCPALSTVKTYVSKLRGGS
jgi:hypothetical protein